MSAGSQGKDKQSNGNKKKVPPSEPTVCIGTIVKSWPHTNAYEVTIAGKSCVGYSASPGISSDKGLGCTEASVYLAGTSVLCMCTSGGQVYIVASLGDAIKDLGSVFVDIIGLNTGTGISEPIHKDDFAKNRGVQNRSGGTPGDVLPGDWGSVNQLGGGIMLSQFMTFLRANEHCGIYAFYFDSLLRIHGYNLEEFTASSERCIYNDEGEVHNVEFNAKYPWEALGIYESGDAFKDEKGKWSGSDKPGDLKNPISPKVDGQIGLWRSQKYKGFLGDLEQEYTTLPSAELTDANPASYDKNKELVAYSGLARTIKGADGSMTMVSAKELMMVRYPTISVPHQTAPHDHAKGGDWHGNYKASNKFGEGEDHEKQEAFEWSGDPGAREGGFLDYLAYKLNKYHNANFAAHKNDWRVPEEKETAQQGPLSGISRSLIDISKIQKLQKNYWADLPKSTFIDVDHKVKGVEYYEGMSCIALQDDGSVLLEDAWGSQIVMSRGNISIQPAGDILMRPGRSVVMWSGGDIVCRAGKSVDITSSHKDVRIKAEYNLHMLSGNSEAKVGGTLIESRAESKIQDYTGSGTDVLSSGVIVKSNDTPVALWGADVFLSTHVAGSGLGMIYLDAKDGQDTLFVKCNNFLELLGGSHVMNFIDASEANYFGSSGTLLDSKMIMRDGLVVIDGGIISNGVVAGKNVVYGGSIPTFLFGADGLIQEKVSEADSIAASYTSTLKNITSEQDKLARSNDSLIDPAVIQSVGFSLRTDKQYKVQDDFSFSSARWQQYLGDGGFKWEEPVVISPSGAKTRPHPGIKWKEAVFSEQKPVNYDLDTGLSKSTDSLKNEAGEPTKVIPENAYKIVVNPKE